MRNRIIMIAVMAGAMLMQPESPRAQQQGLLNYQDISQRRTRRTEREDRQARQAEEARKRAEEERRRQEREQRQQRWREREGESRRGMQTTTNDRGTTRGRDAGNNRRGENRNAGPATAPATAGGQDPTSREVTEVLLDAIKTRRVNFDPEEARNTPGIILLNPPKTDPAERRRAAEDNIAQPL